MRPISTGAATMLLATALALSGCSRGGEEDTPTKSELSASAPSAAPEASPAPEAGAAPQDGTDDASSTNAPTSPLTPPPAPPEPDAARLAMGAQLFKKAQCTTCHGANGEGTRFGPSLAGASWVHCDGSVQGILEVIHQGIPVEAFKNPKYGMKMSPATKYITDEDQLLALAQYVHSLAKK